MKKLIRIVPIPMCGLILALVSLGNLLKEAGLVVFGTGLGIIGGILMLLIFGKLIFYPKEIAKELQQPVIASVAPTFTMALMVICTYLTDFPIISQQIRYVWLLLVGLHWGLMFYFTWRFVVSKKFQWENLFPSWFIVYVGIGVISVTAGKFYPIVGQVMFWVGLVLYLALLPFILYRVFIFKKMPQATLPLTTIIAAPGSLCLTGYLKIVTQPSEFLVLSLFFLSQILYFLVLFQGKRLLKIPFFPSYAAFTFPLVISATACFQVQKFLFIHQVDTGFLPILVVIEMGIAVAIVLYVLARYGIFLSSTAKEPTGQEVADPAEN
ncbi:TDT family transporter [Enterococcus massiliensis]|uniref:TDT family transporter n=1 Tax=Enterococcus massiliensis TaxID=1640685 RepID=UPI00065DCABD|nr:TDT family transporter [Enterococcus massiliensis]